jgi:hypothetical protein
MEFASQAKLVSQTLCDLSNANIGTGVDGLEDEHLETNTTQLVIRWLHRQQSGPWLMVIDGADTENHLMGAFESEQHSSGQPEVRPSQPFGWLP